MALTYKELGGLRMGKSEALRRELENYPGKVYTMRPNQIVPITATEARQGLAHSQGVLDDIAAKMEQQMADSFAREAVYRAGSYEVRGFGVHHPPMVTPPIPIESQAVLATFNICPQCNAEGVTVTNNVLGESMMGRKWCCPSCTERIWADISAAQTERSKREYEELRKLQELTAPLFSNRLMKEDIWQA